MVELPADLLQHIHAHASRAYPEECCGVLLGADADDGTRRIGQALPADNLHPDAAEPQAMGRARRYVISPEALLRAESVAQKAGLDIVGIYHSHPDHPAAASEFDRAHALPFWSYVIVSCLAGRCADTLCFRLRDDRSRFDPEPLRHP